MLLVALRHLPRYVFVDPPRICPSLVKAEDVGVVVFDELLKMSLPKSRVDSIDVPRVDSTFSIRESAIFGSAPMGYVWILRFY